MFYLVNVADTGPTLIRYNIFMFLPGEPSSGFVPYANRSIEMNYH